MTRKKKEKEDLVRAGMRRQKASWVDGLTLLGSCRAAVAPHQLAGGSYGVLAEERADEARAV